MTANVGKAELTQLGERIAERIAELLDPQQLATLGKGGRVPSTTLRYNVRQAKAAIPKIVADELEAALRAAANAQRILESLTVGGSEFVGDPERCAEYIRNKISTLQDIAKDAMKPAAPPAKSAEQVRKEFWDREYAAQAMPPAGRFVRCRRARK